MPENVSKAKTTHNQSLSFKNVMSWGPVHTMSDRSNADMKEGKGVGIYIFIDSLLAKTMGMRFIC